VAPEKVEPEPVLRRGLRVRRADDLVRRVRREVRTDEGDPDGDRREDETKPAGGRQARATRTRRPHGVERVRRRGVSNTVARSDRRFATMYTATRMIVTVSTVAVSRLSTAWTSAL